MYPIIRTHHHRHQADLDSCLKGRTHPRCSRAGSIGAIAIAAAAARLKASSNRYGYRRLKAALSPLMQTEDRRSRSAAGGRSLPVLDLARQRALQRSRDVARLHRWRLYVFARRRPRSKTTVSFSNSKGVIAKELRIDRIKTTCWNNCYIAWNLHPVYFCTLRGTIDVSLLILIEPFSTARPRQPVSPVIQFQPSPGSSSKENLHLALRLAHPCSYRARIQIFEIAFLESRIFSATSRSIAVFTILVCTGPTSSASSPSAKAGTQPVRAFIFPFARLTNKLRSFVIAFTSLEIPLPRRCCCSPLSSLPLLARFSLLQLLLDHLSIADLPVASLYGEVKSPRRAWGCYTRL